MGYAWGSFHKHPDYRHKRRRSRVATEALQAALTGDPEEDIQPLAPEAYSRAQQSRKRYATRNAPVELSWPVRVLVFLVTASAGIGLSYLVIVSVARRLAEIW